MLAHTLFDLVRSPMLGRFLKKNAPAPAAAPARDAGPPPEVLRAATTTLSAEEMLERQGRVAETEQRLRAAAADADDAAALEALAAFLLRQRRLDEAQDVLDEALARMPGAAGLLLARGLLAQARLDVDEAVACLRLALAARPRHADTRYHLAMQLLLKGELREAMLHMSARLERPGHNAPYWTRTLPRWQGEPLAGRRLLIEADWGGLGDELQFARYIACVRRDFAPASLQVACSEACERLIAAIPGVDRAFSAAGAVEADCHIGLMDLPVIYGHELADIPAPARYLEPLPGDVAHWSRRLGERRAGELRVGLCWAAEYWGGGEGRSEKSVPLPLFAGLAALPGLRCVSLQKGRGRAELPCAGLRIEDYTEDIEDMGDTAALIDNLDAVLTVDTSVAHLAGALGKPVIMLLKRESGMFWLLEREDTPWYPRTRIVRQAKRGEWAAECARAVTLLREWRR